MGARLMWDRRSLATHCRCLPRVDIDTSTERGRYGARVRRVSAMVLCVGALVAASAGCSTGGGGAGDLGANTQPPNNRVACSLIAQLPDSASLLQRVNVRDPETFNRVLDEAVGQY